MIKSEDAIFQRFYSDPKYEKTREFYTLVRQYLTPQSRVLNLGAGDGDGTRWGIRKGEAAEIVGADIDEGVKKNTQIDRWVLMEGDRLPFADQSFDLVFSDFVVEHVEKPDIFLSEVYRVLKPGGAYVFRTPNKYHYVALIARATPHWVHLKIANRLRGLSAEAYDPFPTYYRMNTRSKVRQLASRCGFKRLDMKMVEGHPSYLVFATLPFLAGVAYERFVSSSEAFAGLRANIFAVLVK